MKKINTGHGKRQIEKWPQSDEGQGETSLEKEEYKVKLYMALVGCLSSERTFLKIQEPINLNSPILRIVGTPFCLYAHKCVMHKIGKLLCVV